MLNKLATARAMGVRAFQAGKWPDDNPFTEPQLQRAWHIAWMAENYKAVELMLYRERNEGSDDQ